MSKVYIFNTDITAKADPAMNNATVKNLWNGFCLKSSEITIADGEKNTFSIGNVKPPILPEGKEWALRIDENGAAVTGRDYGGLMRGYCALLMKIDCDEEYFILNETYAESSYTMKNRMLHLCVFPENDMYFIKKIARLAGLCQYTHIVIEFWGMFKYDCMKELSWPHAFTKDQVRELIREIREIGMEPIPMLNQLGHAPMSRCIYGKHVVLDQNPRLQYLFTPDGWAWKIDSEKVDALLKQMRLELYEVFGDGEYIHIGCDEPDYYIFRKESRKKLPEYLNRLTCEVAKEGRRPMLWVDMFLEKGAYPNCHSACEPDEVDVMQKCIHQSSVMIDWQYTAKTVPIPSIMSLKESTYDVMGAPWFDPENYCAFADTIVENNFYGIMLTTWDTLKDRTPTILGLAKKLGASTFTWALPIFTCTKNHEETATMLRRLSFEGNSYADCGWIKEQIIV